ncbi:MAG: 1-aminocyclopropane-1-carboxylate deaminase/D-cysteine desulfhydrase [Chloroflexota bacterium]
MIPLFKTFPRLAKRLPYVSFCTLPTPVERLESAGAALGINLYIKRDDCSGEQYGGNKPRRLEFLLAQAQAMGAREVVTFGYAGSNHALATAIYAKELGLGASLMLLEQPNASYVRRNVGASYLAGARLFEFPDLKRLVPRAVLLLAQLTISSRRIPFVVTAGGSSPRGTIGYVNAALELKEQIEAGQMPEPDLVYVPFGSMGTFIGLAIGFQFAGLKTRVIGVDVVGERWGNASMAARLQLQTNQMLRSLDGSIPTIPYGQASRIKHGFLGSGYALFTEEGLDAVDFLNEHDGIHLDGTYSGKTFAALRSDAQAGALSGQTILFWNTYNSRPLATLPDGEYRRLPRAFHHYFESEVQPLELARQGGGR